MAAKHPKISVAVPSRHRKDILTKFIETFNSSLKNTKDIPYLTIIYDAPDNITATYPSSVTTAGLVKEIFNPKKRGLTSLWNQCIINSPTDWVLVCNDDIEFKPGWVEYLEDTIKAGQHDLIHLFHYGAFCIHKSMMLKVGWFDERFHGGGYEDNDYQLRIFEAGLKDRVDRSHDFIRNEGPREVGHFIDHTKHVHKGEGWQGQNNEQWIATKWGGRNWHRPSYRKAVEIDWHPSVSTKYSNRFDISRQYREIGKRSMEEKKEIFH